MQNAKLTVSDDIVTVIGSFGIYILINDGPYPLLVVSRIDLVRLLVSLSSGTIRYSHCSEEAL